MSEIDCYNDRSLEFVLDKGSLAHSKWVSVSFTEIIVDACDTPPEVHLSRTFNFTMRLSLGPLLEQEGAAPKRGVRIDAWVGMSHHADFKMFEGSIIDDANEVVMTKGEPVMIKLPCIDKEDTGLVFPGIGLMIDWANASNGGSNSQWTVLPITKLPTYSMIILPLSFQDYRATSCRCSRCYGGSHLIKSDADHRTYPDHIPKVPNATAPAPPKKRSAKRTKPDDVVSE
jgi:hypothetical protein